MASDTFVWPAPPSGLRQLPPVSQPLFTFIYTQLFIAVQFGDYAQARPGDVCGESNHLGRMLCSTRRPPRETAGV